MSRSNRTPAPIQPPGVAREGSAKAKGYGGLREGVADGRMVNMAGRTMPALSGTCEAD